MGDRLKGKVAVLTGGGDDIAQAVAVRFAAEGAAVVGSDIAVDPSAEPVAAGGCIESLPSLDLSAEVNAVLLAEFAVRVYGGIDILCNSTPAARAGADESTAADDRSLPVDHDLMLPWLVTRSCIPELRRSGGNVIFLASASDPPTGTGHLGNIADLTAYATAKARILRLAITLASELGPAGIRVNTLRRAGRPEDIATAALFLASDEAASVTGTDLRVDAGWLAPGDDAALMRAAAD